MLSTRKLFWQRHLKLDYSLQNSVRSKLNSSRFLQNFNTRGLSLVKYQRLTSNKLLCPTFLPARSIATRQKEVKKDKNFSYKCPHCNFIEISKASMKKHIVTEHQLSPFQCLHCNEGFTNFQKLRGHSKTHHPEHKMPQEPYERVPTSNVETVIEKSLKTEKEINRRSLKMNDPKMAVNRKVRTPKMVIVQRELYKNSIDLYPMISDNLKNHENRQAHLYKRCVMVDLQSLQRISGNGILNGIFPMKSDSIQNFEFIREEIKIKEHLELSLQEQVMKVLNDIRAQILTVLKI